MNLRRILIIQTAFIGDVILATPLIEKLHHYYPKADIDFLLRKGNESLLQGHPYTNKLLIWNKKQNKYSNLLKILSVIRKNKYDLLINIQRFASTGFISAFSKAKFTVGFNKNPLSFTYSQKVAHIVDVSHEVERNIQLIQGFTDEALVRPKLYPLEEDYQKVKEFKTGPYICLAPTSVWFTKQFPAEKWMEFIDSIPFNGKVYLLGAPGDKDNCEDIRRHCKNKQVVNLAGQLSLLQSAALMQDAILNYVNDSAPLHLASGVNAPTCAVFCSTVPQFGFYPLADFSKTVEIEEPLSCRPCGLHGYKACPLQHFNCAYRIKNDQLLDAFQLVMQNNA